MIVSCRKRRSKSLISVQLQGATVPVDSTIGSGVDASAIVERNSGEL